MTSKNSATGRDQAGFEDMLEDVVGFNYRSFRTIWDLLARPNRVFLAYAERDLSHYTPALRLWLGLTVVQSVLSFFFGGQADLILNVMQNWPDAQRESLINSIDGTLEDVADRYASTFSLLQPIVISVLLSTTVFLIAVFDKGLSWVSRINLTFAVLTAGSVLGLLMLPFLVQNPQYGLWSMIPIFAVYWLTMFRGSRNILATSLTGRLLKATLFGVIVLLLVMIAGFVTVGVSLTHAVTSLQSAPAV